MNSESPSTGQPSHSRKGRPLEVKSMNPPMRYAQAERVRVALGGLALRSPSALRLVVAALWLGCIALPSIAEEARHVVAVVLADGKELRLENPFSRGVFDCGEFTIESELSLIDQIAPNPNGGWTLSYNNGLALKIKRLAGEIQYAGDFGTMKLDWARVTKLSTIRNENKQREVSSFSKDHHNHQIKITFRGGNGMVVHAAKGDLHLPGSFRQFKVSLYPSMTHLVFDWASSTVKASAGASDPVTMTLTPPGPGDGGDGSVLGRGKRGQTCQTDVGEIAFDWRSVAETQPIDAGPQPFAGEHTCVLADGTKLEIASIKDTFSDFDWKYQEAHPRKIDGREAREIFWNSVSEIRAVEVGAATCVFGDGKERLVAADLLEAEWSFGTIEIPFSNRAFSCITRNPTAVPLAAKKPLSHHVQFQSGDAWDATLLEMSPFSMSTAPGVLHLVEIPVAHGLLLTRKEDLALTIAGQKVEVRAFSKTYPVVAADLDKIVGLATSYGEFEVVFKTIASLEPAGSAVAPAGARSVTATFRDGTQMTLPCSKVEFVRYPDEIFNGTYYNGELGAWFWRRYDKITVVTPEGTTDVELERVKGLGISGSSPTWDVELEGTKSGARLSGRLKPEEAALQSPGVASWNTDKDGFWLSQPGRDEFLFLRIKEISALDLRPAQP